jgi:hypothetical protein
MAVHGMCSGWFDNTDGPLRQSDLPSNSQLRDLWNESESSVAGAAWSDSAPSSQRLIGRSQWDGVASVEKRRPEHPVGSDAALFAAEHEKD